VIILRGFVVFCKCLFMYVAHAFSTKLLSNVPVIFFLNKYAGGGGFICRYWVLRGSISCSS
jgi:hypothetical protein